MSDVNSVAEALGVPAEIISRSAEARATAAGSTAEQVLDAWGGGAPVSSAPPPAATEEPEPGQDTVDAAPGEEKLEETEPAQPVPAAASPKPAPEPPAPPSTSPVIGEPPVLVGVSDNPWSVIAGVAGIFLAAVLLALVGPSLPVDEPGARTSAIEFSADGIAGRAAYGELGCAGCHTQMIRPVVADVGIGPVTLNDSNQVLGVRRFGPDLSNIGNRISGAQIEDTIRGGAGHPMHNLSADAMDDLVAYLLESAPAGGES